MRYELKDKIQNSIAHAVVYGESTMHIRTYFNKYLILILFTLSLVISSNGSRADDITAHAIITGTIKQFKAVNDYTCRLDKRVKKNGVLHEDLDISAKYKKPKHYYFHWNKGMSKGREVIFVAGKHHDKLVAHPGGILQFITLHLDPEDSLAMKENRHSLKHSGLEKIINLIESNHTLAREKGLDAVRYIGEGLIDGRSVWMLEGCFPENQGFYAHKIIISIDRTVKLPIKISIYDWSGELSEEYAFHDLKINVGLNKNDFDPNNPKYNYF